MRQPEAWLAAIDSAGTAIEEATPIARETAIGGVVGTAAALAVTALIGTQLAGLGSALASGAALSWPAWVALAALPLLFVGLATLAARIAVLRALGATL